MRWGAFGALLHVSVPTGGRMSEAVRAAASGPRTALGSLSDLIGRVDNSLKRDLTADGDNEESYPNQESRESYGHYVEVAPAKLPDPSLVATSAAFLATLGLDPAVTATPEFARFFSGDASAAASAPRWWATPYAVSVFGTPILAPDPFGRGNAYGDGRALSLGEVVSPAGERWELQLKGCGTTPFSRGGDGRAVLRSSVREFVVSEAMAALGVPTSRALSLIQSDSATIPRAWYADDDIGRPDHPPDTMIRERLAITCRAAPSFIRVGHFELHSRRAAAAQAAKDDGADADAALGGGKDGAIGAQAAASSWLRALFDHAARREFASEVDASAPIGAQAASMLRAFARRQAELTAHWLRVGYVQGNMNSDNCLLSGRTLDYGPFGFVEAYEPLWSPFTSDAERKFGFERQPLAAQAPTPPGPPRAPRRIASRSRDMLPCRLTCSPSRAR